MKAADAAAVLMGRWRLKSQDANVTATQYRGYAFLLFGAPIPFSAVLSALAALTYWWCFILNFPLKVLRRESARGVLPTDTRRTTGEAAARAAAGTAAPVSARAVC